MLGFSQDSISCAKNVANNMQPTTKGDNPMANKITKSITKNLIVEILSNIQSEMVSKDYGARNTTGYIAIDSLRMALVTEKFPNSIEYMNKAIGMVKKAGCMDNLMHSLETMKSIVDAQQK